jgi:hypothetical protein
MSVHIVERITLSPEKFHAMRTATRPDALPAPPNVLCKVLIGGKWHACDRQYSCGTMIHFARPIVVRVLART